MSSRSVFVSVDPSMSNTAVVYGYIENNNLVPIGYKLFQTVKSINKRKPVMLDRLERITDTICKMNDFINVIKPDICFGELPSGSQSSSASVGVGVSLSILAMLPNLKVVTPMDVKKVVGKGVISKEDIIEYCINKYPTFPYERKKDVIIKGRMEHVCDAIVIAEAAFNTKQ